jgi:hypothetical protein
MKSLVIVLLLVIIAFLTFNGRETFTEAAKVESASSVTPLPRGQIENIIEAVQAKSPNLMPIETVFINPVTSFQGGDVVNTRMMFYNTDKYSGEQLDIQAQVGDEGASIISMTPAATPELAPGLSAYTGPKYRDYQEIQKSFDTELQNYIKGSRDLVAKEVPF